ncbi:MAG TPA: FAD-dependent oxidoreductase, partial [Edaphobacter sp.]|nr:FAD-dependent oxidoreductase [Edaphobacter sp.]
MSGLQKKIDQFGKLDCAIVGGGVSGLYSGWRLRQEHPDWNIAIFEMSDRTGGRLLSWLPYGPEAGLRAELGGMRFFQEQELVWNLIGHLGLQIVQFFASGENLLWYLRGSRMAEGDADAAALRYALSQGERGMQAATLLEHIIYTVLHSDHNRTVLNDYLKGQMPTTREDWDAIKPYLTYKDEPLWNVGFWNLLSDLLSYEAYTYVTDSFGYYTLTGNWNAAEAMQSVSLDFTQNPDYKTLAGGYSLLPATLDRAFRDSGGKILLNTQMTRFDIVDGKATLSLFDTSDRKSMGTVQADRLILALPRASLDFLDSSPAFDPKENPELQQLLNAVVGYPAFKLFMLYDERWWEQNDGPVHGRSVCDLPIRQTYYFRPDACEEGGTCEPYGLLMASYDDAQAVDYWKGMEVPFTQREQNRAELRQLLQGLRANFGGVFATAFGQYDPPPNFHKAPELMVQRATEQLALLHGVTVESIPTPKVGAYADWSLEPFGGGWNFWQPQANVKDVMTKVK